MEKVKKNRKKTDKKKKNITFMTEEQVCKELQKLGIFEKYLELSEFRKQCFMEFCTGKSLKMLTYDSIFKHIFKNSGNFEYLEHFLTAVLGFRVEIIELLSTESEKLVESGSIMILDEVARATDGSIVNVEIQKSPYMFSGQRESCYAADILARQFSQKKQEMKQKRILEENDEKNKYRFDYGQMRPIYTVIILENSHYQFLDYPDIWKHTGRVTFDSGIELNYLYNFIYVTLDKFRELNENEEEELNRWIYLLSANTPEEIIRVAGMSDEFFEIIRRVSIFCMDVERVLNMVSEALIEFDRGTEELMLEEAREETKKLQKETEKLKKEVEESRKEVEESQKEAEELKKEIEGAKKEAEKLRNLLLATGQYTSEELEKLEEK